MREITISEVERAQASAEESEETFHMDEESFRGFYERTARSLRSYLSRTSGDPALADDLFQETYYRFLRAAIPVTSEAHRKNYLFRIATNLLRDHWRRHKSAEFVPLPDSSEGKAVPASDRMADKIQQRSDLGHVLGRLKPREREILWMAYVEGFNHKEIGEAVGVKAASIRLLLFRARHKLAGVLRHRNIETGKAKLVDRDPTMNSRESET